jgi:prepilin-type N-terminal cleavage/methylation domain-containing protein
MRKSQCLNANPGFTLVELLVVIVLMVALCTLVFMFTRTGMARASSSSAMSRLRESGILLLADAQEKNGVFQYSLDDTPRDSPYLPYNIIRKALGVEMPGTGLQTENQLCRIMHWDADKLKPAVYHRNCFGVNFTDKPGVDWSDEIITVDDNEYEVHTLIASTVSRSISYPILLDSSDSRGNEVFRIHDGEDDPSAGPSNSIRPHARFPRQPRFPSRVAAGYVGLRNSGKAHAFFLDGSVRGLDTLDLKAEGFTKAYDNSTSPPVLRSL